MSLDEKIIDPLAPAEPPGQNPDLLPKSGKKRRKGEGASPRKAKKFEDEDDSADVTAVLTMDEAPRKQPKKMLFEPNADSGPMSQPTPVARKDNGSTRAALSATAAVMPAPVPQTVPQTVPTPVAVAPAAPTPKAFASAPEPTPAAPKAISPSTETTSTAPVDSVREEPQPQTAAAAEPPADHKPQPIADVKGSVFQVATLATREPDPEPTPEPTESSQASLDLETPIGADTEQSVTAAAGAVDDFAPDMPETAIEEQVDAPAEVVASSETATFAALIPEIPTFAGLVDDDTAVAAIPTPSVSEPTVAAKPEASPTPAEMIQPAAVDKPAPTPVVQPAPTPVRPVPVAAQPKAPEPAVEPETPTRLSRSEMIARSARMSALSSSRANGSAAAATPAPRPAAPPPPQQRPTELPKHAGDLYGYWTRVKNGRRFPSRADFDVEQMAENFPNSMLLTCGANGGSQVNFSSILRLGANRRAQPGEALSFTSMITEWILAIGGEAARAGTPVQDTEVFPSPDGTFAYKIVALPLSDQQTRVDHVLCHLSRS